MAYRAPAPLRPSTTGTLQQQVASLADAISRKSDQTLEPVYAAVQLIAPNGSVWKLTIGNTGTITTAQVPRP